jgi:hypothetical protein
MGIENTIEFGLTSLIRKESSPKSPVLEAPQQGLAINIDGLEVDGERAEFELLITGAFTEGFCLSFQRLYWAPIIHMQDVSGRVGAFKPIDTHKKYPPKVGPNWKAGVEGPKGRSRTIWIRMPLWVDIGNPVIRPSLFLTAHLHSFVSNTLALDFKEGKVTSLDKGMPHAVRLDSAAEVG